MSTQTNSALRALIEEMGGLSNVCDYFLSDQKRKYWTLDDAGILRRIAARGTTRSSGADRNEL